MNDIYLIASVLWVVFSFMWLMKLEIGQQAPVNFERLSDRCREILTSRTVRLPLKEPVSSRQTPLCARPRYYACSVVGAACWWDFDEYYEVRCKTHEDVSLQKAIDLIVEHCGIVLDVTPATGETMKIVKKPRSKK